MITFMAFLSSAVPQHKEQYSVSSDCFVAVEIFGSAGCEKHLIGKNLFRK
jgi:hypothetical protein